MSGGYRCCFYLSPCIVLHRYLSTCITAKLSNSPSIKLFSCVANIASKNAFSLSVLFNKQYHEYFCSNFIQLHFKIVVQQTFLFCIKSHSSNIWILQMCYTYRVIALTDFKLNCDLLAEGFCFIDYCLHDLVALGTVQNKYISHNSYKLT